MAGCGALPYGSRAATFLHGHCEAMGHVAGGEGIPHGGRAVGDYICKKKIQGQSFQQIHGEKVPIRLKIPHSPTPFRWLIGLEITTKSALFSPFLRP